MVSDPDQYELCGAGCLAVVKGHRHALDAHSVVLTYVVIANRMEDRSADHQLIGRRVVKYAHESATLTSMTMMHISAGTVGARLRASRRAANIDQGVMAAQLGLARTTISNWERGVFEPTVSQFIVWAQITGQPAHELIEGLPAILRTPAAGESEPGSSYTPRDLNPEPTAYGSRFWAIVAGLNLPALTD
jgi:transcriptional regulator with XRE-family HTH domain